MRVSTKSDYALRALIELVGTEGGPISAEEIAGRQEIPRSFLLAILADLRRAAIVTSQRGPAGGWRLSAPPDEVSVADVIRAVDGPLVSIYDQRPESVRYNPAAAPLQTVWIATRQSIREVLERVTLAQLATGGLPAEVSARAADEDAWLSR